MDMGGGGGGGDISRGSHLSRTPPPQHTHINMVITGYNNMLIGIVNSVLCYKQNCI